MKVLQVTTALSFASRKGATKVVCSSMTVIVIVSSNGKEHDELHLNLKAFFAMRHNVGKRKLVVVSNSAFLLQVNAALVLVLE